jgi:hypothetical protein
MKGAGDMMHRQTTEMMQHMEPMCMICRAHVAKLFPDIS